MTQGESTANALPGAADVLREAYELAGRPDATGLGIDRAAVLLGIARELREGAKRVPPVIVGDNVPPEIVDVISEAHAERDQWRRAAEGAQKEIAELLRQGDHWRRQSESLAAQLDELAESRHLWQQRAQSAEQQVASYARTRSEPVFDVGPAAGVDYGHTMSGEPAFMGVPVVEDKLADPGLWNTAVMGVSDELRATLGGAVREATQQVPYVDPVAKAERLKLDEVKVAVPVERPADIRFPQAAPIPREFVDPVGGGECETCKGDTYEAVTADGAQTRHRETGTSACPVR
jgi:hypothetical protein